MFWNISCVITSLCDKISGHRKSFLKLAVKCVWKLRSDSEALCTTYTSLNCSFKRKGTFLTWSSSKICISRWKNPKSCWLTSGAKGLAADTRINLLSLLSKNESSGCTLKKPTLAGMNYRRKRSISSGPMSINARALPVKAKTYIWVVWLWSRSPPLCCSNTNSAGSDQWTRAGRAPGCTHLCNTLVDLYLLKVQDKKHDTSSSQRASRVVIHNPGSRRMFTVLFDSYQF